MLLLHQNICTIKSVHYNSHITLLLHNVFHNIIQNMSENLLYMELLCMILYLSTFVSSQNLRNQVWGDCKNLWRTITNNDMSFADKGIKQSGRTKDGKKFFDVKETRLMDILNVPITVVDFETNVKTKQGEGRYCVLFEQNGQRSKFITNCYNLKDVLDQAREAENNGQKIFPVENVIVKRRSLGDGKSAYYFEE